MTFRVQASDGTLQDFDTEDEARVLYKEKKKKTGKLVLTGRIKSLNLHECNHDVLPRIPCRLIEKVGGV